MPESSWCMEACGDQAKQIKKENGQWQDILVVPSPPNQWHVVSPLTTVEECNVLQCKRQDKMINLAQVAIKDEQFFNDSNHSSDNGNLSDDNSLYDKLMKIIDTQVQQQKNINIQAIIN